MRGALATPRRPRRSRRGTPRCPLRSLPVVRRHSVCGGADDGVRPALEVVAALGLDAEDLGDDGDRQRDGEVVRRGPSRRMGTTRVEQVSRDLADARLHLGDHARREGAVHEVAQVGVVGRIGVDDRARAAARRAPRPMPRGREDLRILEDVADVVVAADRPEAHVRLHDGRLLAQARVGGVRVGLELRGEGVEFDHRGSIRRQVGEVSRLQGRGLAHRRCSTPCGPDKVVSTSMSLMSVGIDPSGLPRRTTTSSRVSAGARPRLPTTIRGRSRTLRRPSSCEAPRRR